MSLFVSTTDTVRNEWVRQVATALNWLLRRAPTPYIPVPATKTADFTVTDTDVAFINNKPAAGCVATLPNAAQYSGRLLYFVNHQAQTLTSAAANVVPIAGGAAGNAILPAAAGAFATLASDGVNWVVIAQ